MEYETNINDFVTGKEKHKKVANFLNKPKKRKRRKVVDLVGFNKTEEFRNSCKLHFMNRYYERFGFKCKHYVYNNILDLVRSSKPYKSATNPNRSLYEIEYDGVKFNIVHDHKLDTLVTLLEPRK